MRAAVVLSIVCLALAGCGQPGVPDLPLRIEFADGLAPDPSYAGTTAAFVSERYPDVVYDASELTVGLYRASFQNYRYHGFLRFDLEGFVPAGATVERAYLMLSLKKWYMGYASSCLRIACFPLAQDWNPGEVDWNNASGTAGTGFVPWAIPGGPFTPGIASEVLKFKAINSGKYPFVCLEIDAAVVQGWVDDPSANHGLVMRETVGGTDFSSLCRFYGPDWGDAARRPRLGVLYSYR